MEQLHFSTLSQWSLEKSNYGPKGAGLYNPADNAKRKANNVESLEGVSGNRNVKEYSSAGLSAKQSAATEASKYKKINRKQPVKVYTPEEIKVHQEKLKIAKNGQWSI